MVACGSVQWYIFLLLLPFSVHYESIKMYYCVNTKRKPKIGFCFGVSRMLQSFGYWAVLCFCTPRATISTLFRANRYIKTNYKPKNSAQMCSVHLNFKTGF